jgi:hypothetical protein
MKELIEALKILCQDAYWYGENTGDYDMSNVDEQVFFKAVLNRIKELKKID